MSEKILTCPECRSPYYIYTMMVGDQSRCSRCKNKLRIRIEEEESSSKSSNDDFIFNMLSFDFGSSGGGFDGGGGSFGGGGASGDF